jgi:hypothetical protein
MTSAAFARTASSFAPRSYSPESLRKAPRRGLFLRLMDALAEANQRKAERVVAEYIRRNGGTLTDDLERNIRRSFF